MRRRGALWCVCFAACLAAPTQLRADAAFSLLPSLDITAASHPAGLDDALAQIPVVLTPKPKPQDFSSRFGELVVYGGVDGWKHGLSGFAGADWAPFGGSAVTPILRLFGSNGVDDFKSRFDSFRTDTLRAFALPGVRIRTAGLEIKLLIGGDFQMRVPLRPALEQPNYQYGGRIAADLWWEPSREWMVTASASATTIDSGVTGRLAMGWRLPFGWVGPETLASHDIYNTQYRAGAHISGVKLGALEWSVAGGYAIDTYRRNGPYGRVGLSYRP